MYINTLKWAIPFFLRPLYSIQKAFIQLIFGKSAQINGWTDGQMTFLGTINAFPEQCQCRAYFALPATDERR